MRNTTLFISQLLLGMFLVSIASISQAVTIGLSQTWSGGTAPYNDPGTPPYDWSYGAYSGETLGINNNATLTISNKLSVKFSNIRMATGANKTGTLRIEGGSQVIALNPDDATARNWIGEGGNTNATIEVTGINSNLTTATALILAASPSGGNGKGTLKVTNGATANITAALSIGSNGTGTVVIGTGGKVTAASARVYHTDDSLQFELGSPSSFGQLVVSTGSVNLGDAPLVVRLVDGFAPSSAGSFKLLDMTDYSQLTLGNLFTFDFSEALLADGLSWNTTSFETTGTISIEGAVVPEPSSVSLLLLGLLGLGRFCRRKAGGIRL